MLYLPNGELAGQMDPIATQFVWAQHLHTTLRAGIGKPTFPINAAVVDSALHFWQDLKNRSDAISSALEKNNIAVQQEIIDADLAIDYGEIQGDFAARSIMAGAMSRWYNCTIDAKDILFTTGGLNGLYCAFEYLRRKYLHARILTPFPYYSFYDAGNQLFPIPVMENKGYRLTAQSVKESIIAAHHNEKFSHEPLHAVVFCYPNNPLGTVLREDEWKAIAEELKALPDAVIILDEAYAEMDFTHQGASLFSVAPALRDRIILMRSATKGLSAAGERLATIICQNPALMARLLEISSTVTLHPPRHLQMAFAEGMNAFTNKDAKKLTAFYQPQVEYVLSRLKQMHIALPDPDYKTRRIILRDGKFKKITRQKMPERAKIAFTHPNDIITTDEDLAYALLFEDNIMLSPGSYFGIDPTLGYVRITCSVGERDLGIILDKIAEKF